MDQIFDRLEQLLKSWTNPDNIKTYTHRGVGDPDLADAMDELDEFLGTARSAEVEAAARERERQERSRREADAKARDEAGRRATGGTGGGVDPIAAAYTTLGLPNGAPMAEIKAAYKKLLFRYHPDRNSGSPAESRRATEISAKINEAYTTLEAWKGSSGRSRPS